jgi:serine/threonine protein phosphatase PrpC
VYSDNLIEVVEWCMSLDPLSRPQSVFALQKELSREGERRYTKLSVGEKMRLQFDNMVSDTKKNVKRATGFGAKLPRTAMKFSVFQISRKGGREKNEDRMGYCYTRESGLFVLADGMGGHPEGEVAAQMALQTISALYQKEARPVVKDVTEFLSASLMAAHHQIIRYASEKGMLDTPRTTLVAAMLQGTSATWVHCGDSRLYVVRDGELLTRTRDHSYLEQQSAGVIRMDRINRNILFTCLGSPTKPVFDVTGPVTLQQGDKILLCSDGLWGTLAMPTSCASWAARSPCRTPCPTWWRGAAQRRRQQ